MADSDRPAGEDGRLPLDLLPEMGATISACGHYRYDLWRRWGPGEARAYVMLNPSIADATLNDPTIVRCINFAKRDGFDAITVRNLFAYRTPSPIILKDAFKRGLNVVGPENDGWLRDLVLSGHKSIVAAWGAGSSLPKSLFQRRAGIVVQLFKAGTLTAFDPDPYRGFAPHPLYLKDDTPIVPYPARKAPLTGRSDAR